MLSLTNDFFSILEVPPGIDRSQIPLLDVVKLDKESFGRLDLICMNYYRSMSFYPLLLDWNGITDPSKMNIGDLIQIPDMNDFTGAKPDNSKDVFNNFTLFEEEYDGLGYNVPGFVNNNETKESQKKQNSKNGNKMTANSKLNLTKKEAFYDADKGLLVF